MAEDWLLPVTKVCPISGFERNSLIARARSRQCLLFAPSRHGKEWPLNLSVSVRMMNIWHMRVAVPNRMVGVHMAVRVSRHRLMRVSMVAIVMSVGVLMLKNLVLVLMLMLMVV